MISRNDNWLSLRDDDCKVAVCGAFRLQAMTYKDILAPAIALDEDESGLLMAADLAAQFDGRASAMVVAVPLGSDFAEEPQPLSNVLSEIAAGSRSQAASRRKELLAWLEASSRPFDVRDITIQDAVDRDQVVSHAQLADLVVMTRGPGHVRARRALTEDVLFKSGRPLLLLPNGKKRRSVERILIGWNATANAVRAVAGAMPLLKSAASVVVATVDAMPTAADRDQAPGRELAAHLARHGVRTEVHNVDGLGRPHAQVLCEEAMAMDADLLVIGAYGHSRAQEFIFGGVTRDVLANAALPVLLAH